MRAIVALAVLGACVGCSKQEAATKAEPQAAAEMAAAAPAPAVRTWDEGLHPGKTVTLEGSFLGGDLKRTCKYATNTRPSGMNAPDWLIEKDGRCMWVAEAMQVFGAPEESLNEANVGRRVEVTATVAGDEEGRLFLQATDAHAVE